MSATRGHNLKEASNAKLGSSASSFFSHAHRVSDLGEGDLAADIFPISCVVQTHQPFHDKTLQVFANMAVCGQGLPGITNKSRTELEPEHVSSADFATAAAETILRPLG